MSQIKRPQLDIIRKKKNRKSITLAVKLEIINRILNGERASMVARSMGLPESTVRTINKDADRIRECCKNANSLSAKISSRKRSKIMESLENKLCQWLQLMSERSLDVSMAMIQERALDIFKELQEQEPDDSPDKKEKFTASRGWFDRFKKRQNVYFSAYGYEKISVRETKELELNQSTTNLFEGYTSSSEDTRIKQEVPTIKQEEDGEPAETVNEYLDFQMVVYDNEKTSEYADIKECSTMIKQEVATIKQEEDGEPAEAVNEYLDFQMVVYDNEKTSEYADIKEEETFKMSQARTSMVDIQVDPKVLKDKNERTSILQKLEEILKQWNLKKKFEDTFGDSHIVLFNNDNGSLTATVKTYPFGVISVTFEHTVEETSVTNSKLEEMRRIIAYNLEAKCESIPPIKRGSPVPLYFTSADERILEYDFNKVLFYADSQYQNIKILQSPTLGNCLILDDLQNLADSDINYTHGVMKYGSISYTGKDVLILGGGDGGLLHELLKENPKFVTMVDIDQMVIDACREHLRGCCGDSLDKLEGSNYKVIIDDCLKMLDEYKNEGRKFDVVINDLTDIPISTTPQGELWDFVKTILVKSMVVLKDDGSYLNHAISEGCVDALKNYENVLMSLPNKVTFEKHMAFVPSFMENWVFYEVKKV